MLLAAAVLAATTPCPEGATCLQADRLFVVSADADRAQSIFDTALGAQALFEAQFGITAQNAAVVENVEAFPGLADALKEAGYRVKPWISPAMMRQSFEAQMRPVMEQRMGELGLSPDAIEARIQTILNDRVDQNERVRHQDAIIAHELGHIWLIEGFDWPEVDTGGARSYGAGAAPDWLDETFAVAMETDTMTAERREFFCSQPATDLPAEITEFLTMEHPLLNAASAAADARARALEAAGQRQPGQSGPQIMVMTTESLGVGDSDALSAARFYGLSRVMVDYAEATTGGVEVYSDLSTHIAEGGTQDSWLAQQTHGWPTDIEALSQAVTQFVGTRCDV